MPDISNSGASGSDAQAGAGNTGVGDVATQAPALETSSNTAQFDTGQTDTGAESATAPEGDPGQTTAAAPTDVATARSLRLISEHFGIDAGKFPPEVVSELSARAETAMFDQLLGTPQQPDQNAQQPGNQPAANQPAAGIDEINVDFAPFLEQIQDEFGETGAKAFQGALEHLTGEFNKRLGPLTQMQQAIRPMLENYVAMATHQEQTQIRGFFDGLAKDPTWAVHLAGEGGAKLRTEAEQIARNIQKSNPNLSGEQLLMRGFLAATRKLTSGQAIKSVQAQVERKARQISTPPGQATGVGRNPTTNQGVGEPPDARTAWRQRALADIERKMSGAGA